jgi:retron-type reverse transcriptase
VDELKSSGKPFDISKRAVWEAWEKVKANKGAPGVDGVSIAEFEKDLKSNLYKEGYSRLPPKVQANNS